MSKKKPRASKKAKAKGGASSKADTQGAAKEAAAKEAAAKEAAAKEAAAKGAGSGSGPASRNGLARGWPDPVLLPLWLLILLPPLFVVPGLTDNFRPPKLLMSEVLALLSLATLSLRLWRRPRFSLDGALRDVARSPALHAVLPILLVASLGLFSSAYGQHVRQALPSLWVGAICLVGWSLALTTSERRRLIHGLAIPSVALAGLGTLQFHGLVDRFEFQGRVSERLSMTSLAGGAFDLAGYLVLPALVAVVALISSSARLRPADSPELEGSTVPLRNPASLAARPWRLIWLGVALLAAYTIALTATFTAIAALASGLLILGWRLLARRRFVAAVGVLVLLGLVISAVGPLRPRVEKKLDGLAQGEVNKVLTGRLDPWRAALWMARENPATGVGHGAYRAAYGHARLGLVGEGVRFYRGQKQPYFVNAHSDFLEALAEWGIPGLLAVLWAAYCLARGLLRSSRLAASSPGERALAPAAGVALLLMALTYFPFHLALVAYPWLIFISGPLARIDDEELDLPPSDGALATTESEGEPRLPADRRADAP